MRHATSDTEEPKPVSWRKVHAGRRFGSIVVSSRFQTLSQISKFTRGGADCVQPDIGRAVWSRWVTFACSSSRVGEGGRTGQPRIARGCQVREGDRDDRRGVSAATSSTG